MNEEREMIELTLECGHKAMRPKDFWGPGMKGEHSKPGKCAECLGKESSDDFLKEAKEEFAGSHKFDSLATTYFYLTSMDGCSGDLLYTCEGDGSGAEQYTVDDYERMILELKETTTHYVVEWHSSGAVYGTEFDHESRQWCISCGGEVDEGVEVCGECNCCTPHCEEHGECEKNEEEDEKEEIEA